jgi:hypothetical protein
LRPRSAIERVSEVIGKRQTPAIDIVMSEQPYNRNDEEDHIDVATDQQVIHLSNPSQCVHRAPRLLSLHRSRGTRGLAL